MSDELRQLVEATKASVHQSQAFENGTDRGMQSRIADLERQLAETQSAMFAHEAELQLPENQRILEIRRLESQLAEKTAEVERLKKELEVAREDPRRNIEGYVVVPEPEYRAMRAQLAKLAEICADRERLQIEIIQSLGEK